MGFWYVRWGIFQTSQEEGHKGSKRFWRWLQAQETQGQGKGRWEKTSRDKQKVRLRLHIPLVRPFFGFNVVLWCCLHVTSRISKVSLPKNGDVDGACKRALKVIQMLLIYILSTVILEYLLSCVCNVTQLFKLMMKLSSWKLTIVIRICSLYRKRRQIVRTMNPTLILVIVNQLRQEQEEAVRANLCRTTLAKILKKIVISKLLKLQTAICRFHFHCAHFEKW